MKTYNIANCPDHGIHGERTECFVCGKTVEQLLMTPVSELGNLNSPEIPDSSNSSKRVTRFEVIDRRVNSRTQGRVLFAYEVDIDLSYQDDGRTLKVFLTGEK